MSEKINWIAVCSCSALAAVQLGATIYDGWKAWAKWKRRKTTAYERVINGETGNGWQLVIPPMANLNKVTNELIQYAPVYPPLFGDSDARRDPMTLLDSNVTLYFKHPLPDGRKIYSVRRYAPFRDAEKVLLKVSYDPSQWRPNWSYASIRTITTIFQRLTFPEEEPSRFCVILSDPSHRTSRSFMIRPPEAVESVLCADLIWSPEPQLRIVFYSYAEIEEEDGWRMEFFDCKYQCPLVQGADSAVHPSSWNSISIPVGHRLGLCRFSTGCAMVLVVYDDASWSLGNTDNHLCVSFDHTRTWRVETLTQWLESFCKTTTGASTLEAIQSFAALSPPTQWNLGEVPALRYFRRVFPHPSGNCVLGLTDCEGVLRRWIRPPSLKQLAVEAMFKSNPNVDVAALGEAIGFDVSDGILGDENEGDIEVMRL